MSDRLYARHFNVGLSGDEERELIGDTSSFIAFSVHETAKRLEIPKGHPLTIVPATREEAIALRNKLTAWIGDERATYPTMHDAVESFALEARASLAKSRGEHAI